MIHQIFLVIVFMHIFSTSSYNFEVRFPQTKSCYLLMCKIISVHHPQHPCLAPIQTLSYQKPNTSDNLTVSFPTLCLFPPHKTQFSKSFFIFNFCYSIFTHRDGPDSRDKYKYSAKATKPLLNSLFSLLFSSKKNKAHYHNVLPHLLLLSSTFTVQALTFHHNCSRWIF